MRETENATIEYTNLGREGHGIFTFQIGLKFNGAGQGFGGYALGDWERPSAFGVAAISKVLDVLEVGSWEKLPGTPCRADRDLGKVYRLGHYLKDEWVDLKKMADEITEASP